MSYTQLYYSENLRHILPIIRNFLRSPDVTVCQIAGGWQAHFSTQMPIVAFPLYWNPCLVSVDHMAFRAFLQDSCNSDDWLFKSWAIHLQTKNWVRLSSALAPYGCFMSFHSRMTIGGMIADVRKRSDMKIAGERAEADRVATDVWGMYLRKWEMKTLAFLDDYKNS